MKIFNCEAVLQVCLSVIMSIMRIFSLISQGKVSQGQPSPGCNNLVWLHHLNNKQVQTCLNLVSIMSIWKNLKLAINQLNLFELVQAQKTIYRAVLDSFWILFRNKTFLIVKIENLNFQHLLKFVKPLKISAHSDKHSDDIYLRGIKVVRMSWKS